MGVRPVFRNIAANDTLIDKATVDTVRKRIGSSENWPVGGVPRGAHNDLMEIDHNITLMELDVELLRQLAIARAHFIVAPSPMSHPLPQHEDRSLHLECERHRLEWRGVSILPQTAN